MCINVRRFKYILGNKITKNFPRSLRSLEVKLHVYISFFQRIVCFDFNAFISGWKCINVCVHMHTCIHVRVHACMGVWKFSSMYMRSYKCVCMHACMYLFY